MTKYIIIFVLLLVVGVVAQDISITDFGGLNTNTSVLKLKPHQGNYCLNLDVGKGYLTKRKGYLQLLPVDTWPAGDTLAGDAPNIGILGFRRADGVRRICGIASQSGDTTGASIDSTGLGWFLASPGLPISGQAPPYYWLREGAQWRYYNYVYQGETPFWTYWHDNCYMTNGRQRPLVFHPYNEMGGDGYVRELVLLTPGEPLIVPMEGTGNLNGEYYYMIGHSEGYGGSFGADKIKDGSGDFEDWTGNLPDDWDTLPHATGFIVEETDSVFTGSSALRLTTNMSGWLTGCRVTVETDADSAWVVNFWSHRTTNNGSGIYLSVSDTIGGNLLAYTSLGGSTGVYINHQLNFLPRAGRDSVELSFHIGGNLWNLVSDTVYIDSVTVLATNIRRNAVVTKPVLAFDENVFLTHFLWQTIVAGYTDVTDTAFDTLNIDIYRTKANPGNIDKNDKFWLIESIDLLDKTQIDTLTYIDTLPDDSLGKGSWVTSIAIDTLSLGRDSNLTLTGVRVGAPTYIQSGDGVNDVGHIFVNPIKDSAGVAKTSYICTYYDSLINAESDSSRSLHIYQNENDSVYVIGLPPLPGGKNHLVRRIYKSYDYIIDIPKDSVLGIKDTSITFWYGNSGGYDFEWKLEHIYTPKGFITNIINNGYDIFINPDWGSHYNTDNWNSWINYSVRYYDVDTITDETFPETTSTAYKLIGEIKGSDSVFVDSITFDSTQKGKHYFKSEAPYNLNYITSFGDRLWGSVGSRLYWSYLDTSGVWGSFNDIVLDADDGDKITAIIPMRDYVRVFKNMSQYIVYPGAELEYERREMIEDIGCIAPHTALAYQNGVFYLSHQGLIREQGSEYRDRGSKFGVISEPINNILLNRTRDALRKAYGVVHKEKYWLSFADVDTTFVYHLKTGEWSIYDYAIAQATKYDTNAVNSKSITPSGDMVFINGENDQLYKADTSVSDACTILNDTIAYGTVITTNYRSAPFSISPDFMGISKFGVWRESNDATGGADVRIINAEGDTVSTTYVDTIATRYDIHGVNTDGSNYFQIDVSDTTLDSLAIDRIDLWLYKQGIRPIE